MTHPFHPNDIKLSGIKLIEASAGTGKTFAITQLYIRLLVEEKINLEKILVNLVLNLVKPDFPQGRRAPQQTWDSCAKRRNKPGGFGNGNIWKLKILGFCLGKHCLKHDSNLVKPYKTLYKSGKT